METSHYQCGRCKELKPETEFSPSKCRTGEYCKPCAKEYRREYMERPGVREAVRHANRRGREAIQGMSLEELENLCAGFDQLGVDTPKKYSNALRVRRKQTERALNALHDAERVAKNKTIKATAKAWSVMPLPELKDAYEKYRAEHGELLPLGLIRAMTSAIKKAQKATA